MSREPTTAIICRLEDALPLYGESSGSIDKKGIQAVKDAIERMEDLQAEVDRLRNAVQEVIDHSPEWKDELRRALEGS